MIQSVGFLRLPGEGHFPIPRILRGRSRLAVGIQFPRRMVEYDVGGTTFAITTMDMNHVAGAKGGCVAFEVADLDDCVKTLKLRGARFVAEVMETPVCRLAVVADPDDNAVVIHKRK